MTTLSIHTGTGTIAQPVQSAQPIQLSQAMAFPFAVAETHLDTEAQRQTQMAQIMAQIEGLNKAAEASRRADAERIIELEKALSLSEAQQRATILAYDERLKTQGELIKSLTEATSVLRQEVTVLKAKEKTVEESFLSFLQVYNGHTHTYGGSWGKTTDAPGIRNGCNLHEIILKPFPKPNFEQEGKKG